MTKKAESQPLNDRVKNVNIVKVKAVTKQTN
jgi:hypothetical protein